MIRSLRLKRFKNFLDAELDLGSFTVLIGANAAGKSNIRDAFLFLHGIGRGYTIAEILGEKYSGGDRVWRGVRGGPSEISFNQSDSFEIGLELAIPISADSNTSINNNTKIDIISYMIGVIRSEDSNWNWFGGPETLEHSGIDLLKKVPLWATRTPTKPGHSRSLFDSSYYTPYLANYLHVSELFSKNTNGVIKKEDLDKFTPMIQMLNGLNKMGFLEPVPKQTRIPSIPGQTSLGDQGENLSSVLLAICADPGKKEAIIEWLLRLTPMDVVDLEFESDAAGRILVYLKERNGGRISALSASDGTLRFLTILAALFGPTPAPFYFIEELENGIHPSRLGLLVELIESQTKHEKIQIVATTHSPLLMQYLSAGSLEHASVVYRLPDHADAKIRRVVAIPEASRVLREQSAAILHASNWFEDVLDFTEDPQPNVAGNVGSENKP